MPKKPENFDPFDLGQTLEIKKPVLIDEETGLPLEHSDAVPGSHSELTNLSGAVVLSSGPEVTQQIFIGGEKAKKAPQRARTEQTVFFEQALQDEIDEEALEDIKGDESLSLGDNLPPVDPNQERMNKMLGIDPEAQLDAIEGDEPLDIEAKK